MPAAYPDLELQCRLAELGEVTLAPVGAAPDRRLWREMLASHHPQGWTRRPGGVLTYWIVSARHGRLGGLGFLAASWRQAAQDAASGWSPAARVAHLDQLLHQHRFLLLPGVRIAHLASHALARARLAADWQAARGVVSLAVYTYVGPDQNATGPPGGRPSTPKAVWIQPLAQDWRKRLCAEPELRLGNFPQPWQPPDVDWAAREYGRSPHPDGRVRQRVLQMGRAWEHAPGQPLPVIFPDEARHKGAKRLLSSPLVTMADILQSHREAPAERCRQEPLVLALQCTTTLNSKVHRQTAGLVNPVGGGSRTRGLSAHYGLAVSAARRPLGVFELNATQRDEAPADTPENERWLRGLASASELAAACPQTRVVTVCAREADTWELFGAARSSGSADLRDHLAQQPVLGACTITMAACGGPRRCPERQAQFDLRPTQVRLVPLQDRADQKPLPMLAIAMHEPQPPRGQAPLQRVLLSAEGTADLDHARRCVARDEARWTIKEYFRILKLGTRIKDRSPKTADDLRKCLAFDSVTAWPATSVPTSILTSCRLAPASSHPAHGTPETTRQPHLGGRLSRAWRAARRSGRRGGRSKTGIDFVKA